MKQLYQQKINTKKETKFGLSVITEFVTKSEKMIPKHCPLKCKHILPKWRLLFTKSSFLIFIQLIWLILKQLDPFLPKWRLLFTKSSFLIFIQLIWLILKQLDPFQGWWTALDIYLDTLWRRIFPPLFTSPLGDSCIIFNRKGKENINEVLRIFMWILGFKGCCCIKTL